MTKEDSYCARCSSNINFHGVVAVVRSNLGLTLSMGFGAGGWHLCESSRLSRTPEKSLGLFVKPI